jgi:16S rRNA (uracil1498-N3)-methyltransferase
MGRRDIPSLRSLPRVFVPGCSADEAIDLPKEEVEKLRKVLRLSEGDEIGVLPNDGSILRCEFRVCKAWPKSVEWPNTEPAKSVTLAQALPKGDRIETVIRMGTEIGIAAFVFFAGDRSVVRWDDAKRLEKLRRLQAIAREAAEQSYRLRIPAISFDHDLESVLKQFPDAAVLSEVETVTHPLTAKGARVTLVVGPEGGWSPREVGLIGELGVTLGPRVLRTDTAGPAAAALLLLRGGIE